MSIIRNRLYRGDEGRAGSVLMESVIAIPLFLVTIGWTLWMGELSQGRTRLLISDRYAAWNEGNRHGGANRSPAEVRKRIFNNETGQEITDIKIKSDEGGWYREVRAEAQGKFTMPPWIEGMVQAGTTWDYINVKEKQRMTGRGKPHQVVMRAGDRDEDKDDVNWLAVSFDNWYPRMRGAPASMGAKFAKTPEYERFGTFINWSD